MNDDSNINPASTGDNGMVTRLADALEETRAVLVGADHTAAKYWRKMQDAEREMHARELHHFEEEQKSAGLAAVIERARREVGHDNPPSLIERILNTAPVDALRERDAEKWDEAIAAVQARVGGDGMLDQHRLIRLVNPYRIERKEA